MMQAVQISNTLMEKLTHYIKKQMGLDFSQEKWPDLQTKLKKAMTRYNFDNLTAFISWLISTKIDRNQVEMLAGYLTVKETYFFRNQELFKLLKDRLLPELISQRAGKRQYIRIWSAGCCTGEELYSIAILLKQILGNFKNWNIMLIGTDINMQSLKIASQGEYSEWSFRGSDDSFKEKYFIKGDNKKYKIQSELHNIVSFKYHNLIIDEYPSLIRI